MEGKYSILLKDIRFMGGCLGTVSPEYFRGSSNPQSSFETFALFDYVHYRICAVWCVQCAASSIAGFVARHTLTL